MSHLYEYGSHPATWWGSLLCRTDRVPAPPPETGHPLRRQWRCWAWLRRTALPQVGHSPPKPIELLWGLTHHDCNILYYLYCSPLVTAETGAGGVWRKWSSWWSAAQVNMTQMILYTGGPPRTHLFSGSWLHYIYSYSILDALLHKDSYFTLFYTLILCYIYL